MMNIIATKQVFCSFSSEKSHSELRKLGTLHYNGTVNHIYFILKIIM